jgi:uncharacterized membrane protein YccC
LLTWLRELAATVVTFDRSALEPGYALRCTIGAAIPLAIAAVAGQPALGVPAAIGAFITGFTSLQGIYRTRLAAILFAAAGMSIASFIGTLAAHSTPALVAATMLAGYACGTLGQISPAAATVALNSFVAFVLFSSQSLTPAAAAEQSALVFAGGLIQATLLLLSWPTARRGVERAALADVYRNLAAYARAIEQGSPSMPPITPLATARQVLADPQPFSSAATIARFSRLLEDSEVIRKRLGALASAIGIDTTQSPERSLAASAARALDAIAQVLADGEEPEGALEAASLSGGEIEGISDLAAHLRDAIEAATMLATGRLPRFQLLSRPRPAPYVENHVDWLARDSLRFALVLGVATVLGRHFAADRGYWIPLTAALVLKPDFQTTFLRGFARIGGTIVGAIAASLVLAVTRGHLGLQLAGMLLAAAAAYLSFSPNYALFTVAITSYVVLVLSLRGLPGTTTIAARLLDTLAGGALAMIGYLALPSWEHKRTRALLADLLDAQRDLAVAILKAYAAPGAGAGDGIEFARNEIWKVRTAVETSIDRTRNEPRRHHSVGAGRALRILAATQRIALSSLALESALETQAPVEHGELLPLADALYADMSQLASALRDSRRASEPRRLSAAIDAMQTPADPQQRFDRERLGVYADAISRIARLVGEKKS